MFILFDRLQTRTQFVKLKEVDLASKKQNCRLQIHGCIVIASALTKDFKMNKLSRHFKAP